MKNQGDKEKHEFRCNNCFKIIPSERIGGDHKGIVECPSCGWWSGYDFTEGDESKYGGPGQPLLKQVHSIVDLSTRDSQGRKKLVCRFGWNGEEVSILMEDKDRLGTKITKEGIEPRKDLHIDRLFPKDGLQFLHELKFRFNDKKLKATDIYSNPNVIDCRPTKRWKCVDCGMMVCSCDRPLWKHFKKEKGKCIHSFWLQVTMEGERLETMEDVTLDTVHSGKD